MKKLLRPQDILLLVLAGAGDILEEMRDPLMLVGKAYENVYGFIPKNYRRRHFLKSVTRSLKTGYIQKIEKNGQLYLRLTASGEKKIHRDFSLLSLTRKQWDGKWRVVFFDIAEISKRTRNRLRSKLKELGFGMLQKSVWLTPHDIGLDLYEFIDSEGLKDQVFIIEGKNLLAGETQELAQRIWRLSDLNEQYLILENEIKMVKQLAAELNDRLNKREGKLRNFSVGKRRSKLERQRVKLENLRREIKMGYLKILLADPHLPKALLPDDWAAERVRREIQRLG